MGDSRERTLLRGVSSYGMGVYEAHLRARLRPSIHSRCLGKSDFISRVGLLVRIGPYKAMKGSIRPLRALHL